MAGVGFSLRRLSGGGTYTSLMRLYASAGLISSGPWLISILTLLLVGAIGRELSPQPEAVQRFQVAVTWLFAISLLLSTPLQLLFTRYVSDLIYAGKNDLTVPNMWGALAVMSALSGGLGVLTAPLFAGESAALKVVLIANLVVLGDIWIVIVMLTALREHGKVVLAFLLGYGATFVACLALAHLGEVGLLAGFLLGQSTLLFVSAATVARASPSSRPISWGFLDRRRVHLELLPIGLLYALGVWVDKLVFWLHAPTSQRVLGPFRASEVYDLPIFLAYLAIAPGMAAFLLRIETDYAERHATFFKSIEDGATLHTIERECEDLVRAARAALRTIFRVQGVTFLACLVLGGPLLGWFGISRLHLPLFYVDAAAVSMQVLVLSVISIFFYLDRRTTVLWIVTFLFLTNLAGTLLSLWAGAAFYGYGFALAASVTTVVSVFALDRAFLNLVRDTFMMQA